MDWRGELTTVSDRHKVFKLMFPYKYVILATTREHAKSSILVTTSIYFLVILLVNPETFNKVATHFL